MATWDKNQPAGTLKVRVVDDYIRANNDALQDALARQHTFPGTYGASAGKHVLGETGVLLVDTKVGLGTGTGVIGSLSYATDENIIYRDTGTDISSMTAIPIPSTTKMYFYENTAPTGWTIDGAVADKVLAVKGGAQAYNAAGGTMAGTWTNPSHTLTAAQTPSHRHTAGHCTATQDEMYGCGGFAGTGTGAVSYTGYIGSGGGHSHGSTTFRPYAALGIIATKD